MISLGVIFFVLGAEDALVGEKGFLGCSALLLSARTFWTGGFVNPPPSFRCCCRMSCCLLFASSSFEA